MDKSSLPLLWVTILVFGTAGVVLGLQPEGHIAHGASLFQVVGIRLILAGLVVRWLAIFTLKRSFTVDGATNDDQPLVGACLYRHGRHPAYAGSLLSFVGLGLFFSSHLSLLTIFLPTGLAFLYRISVEKKVLLEFFGEAYRDCSATAKCLIPGIY